MADLSTQTTWKHSVMGNKRIVYADVSGTGTSTLDLVVPPHLRVIDAAVFAGFRTTAGTSVAPTIGYAGTTVVIFQGATTGISYTLKIEGR